MNTIFTIRRCHIKGISFTLLVTVACVIGTGVPDGVTVMKTKTIGRIMTFDYGNRVAVIAIPCVKLGHSF